MSPPPSRTAPAHIDLPPTDSNNLTSSPPPSPPATLDGPNPAPVSTTLNNPSDGLPRRRQTRKVTLDDAVDSRQGSTRRDTSDSNRTGLSRRQSTDPNIGVLRRMTTGLFTPDKKIGKAPTYMGSLKAAILSTYLNVLLVFIPIGWALYLAKHAGHKSSITDTACFITNFIAIIPLAGLLGFATEEAAMRLGQTMGGLLNATLGNAVELIVAILALIKCELAVVQSSLVGSILSNILLVLGMCFFAGGLRYAEQTVKTTAAQLNASLLLIAVIAVLIPSAFHFSVDQSQSTDGATTITDAKEGEDLLAMSHGVAILLLVLYLGYLIFQMWTHAHFYTDDPVTGSTRYPEEVTNIGSRMNATREKMTWHRKKKGDEELANSSPTASSTEDAVPNGQDSVTRREEPEEEDEEEVPQMNVISTVILMVLITVIVGVTAEFLVDSINGLVSAHPSLSAEWVGLILLPIVGNAAEHFTAVSVSVKDKLDLSISVAVGSSIQIALFVIPVIQLLAWCIGKPMTLLFDPYESIVLFLSVLIVNQTLSDGRSNWMEGLVLMFLYLIIAVSFWYYPGSNTATLLGCGDSAVVG